MEIPADWKVVDISNEYGYIFSDRYRQQGVLAIRSISALFSNLDKFSGDLIAGMKKNNKYKLISRENSSVDKLPSVQTVFKADAIVNGKKTDAVIINLIIHYEPQARFYILSYSVLQKDMNKFAVIYKRARDSFKVLE
ncbi:hypothetical protein J4450_00585 [Candidatus Micrarchaeota archaeon]|nr:hypothetical protein [Candidatus Micrarchaeota archaeon]